MKSKARIALIGVVFIWAAAGLWIAARSGRREPTLTYSQFLAKVREGQLAGVTIMAGRSGATQASCRLKDGNVVRTILPPDYRDAITTMQDNLVNIEIQDSSSGWPPVITKAMPFLLLLACWFFLLMRRFPNGPRHGLG